ncbi:MAG TPA: folylpolyglutamate synthase/dihydrofolate synthase family protein [Acidimicrobiales bacterium]|nr:folylpolyglutamate synthase/dihydrofolate synthase family protein [Acidimicrobiales bacterium]
MPTGDDGVPAVPPTAERDAMVAWLDGHTNFELAMPTRLGAPTLHRMEKLCALLGDPQLTYPVVHLTGTNGKGSTARILTELLLAMGLSVGTYTSPNLERVNERLARNGEPIDDTELAEVLGALAPFEQLVGERCNRFELLTAAAFLWFADSPVDVAVVEVGLGGRWDATNVVDPEVAVVTNVSYDHVEVLGPTLGDIAAEKAGIVKPGCRLVVGETDPELLAVFLAAAEANGVAEVWVRDEDYACEASAVAVGGRLLDLRTPGAAYPEVFLPLHGAHQGVNAAGALAAAESFFGAPLPAEVVGDAFAAVRVPGRTEVVGRAPLVVLDGAHNVAGAQALARTLVEEFPHDDVVVVIGLLHGRDPSAMLEPFAAVGVRRVVTCTAPSPRALPSTEIAEAARALGLAVQAAETVPDALALARGHLGPEGTLVVTGSLYVVTEARALVLGSTSWAEPGSLSGP